MLATIPWASELAALAAAFDDHPAVFDGERVFSFRELAAAAGGFAAHLIEAGLVPGQPVATFLPNGFAAVAASFGLRVAGAAEVMLNPALGLADREHCLGLSGARLVITTAEGAASFTELGCVAVPADRVGPRADVLASLPPVPGEAWSRVSFTSGTTGRPKAIVQTHAGRFLANLLQRASLPEMPGPGSQILLMTPYVHGASLLTHAFNDRGASVALIEGVRLPLVESMLAGREINFLFAPPTVLAKMTAAFAPRRFEGMRTIFCGTAPLLPPVYRAGCEMFGPVIRVTYGKSEVTNPISALSPEMCERYYSRPFEGEGVPVGYPGSGVEIAIRDEAGGAVRTGEVGEVHLRARHMLAGHIDADGFHPMDERGWHATGDLGRIDPSGCLYLVGRLADVMKSGGYKVHPVEIEHLLEGTAGAVAVASLASDYWGEVIVAVAEGADEGWEERARRAVAPLARHKRPRAFVRLVELPRNPQGKVVRRQIRTMLSARFRLRDGPHPLLEPREEAADVS